MFENDYSIIFYTQEDWTTLTGLREIMNLDSEELKSKINEVVVRMRELIENLPFMNPTTSRGAWQLRQKLDISIEKLNANANGNDLEDSIERLLVACGENLYNQFAVIAGVINNQNRKSVDIVRAIDEIIQEMIEFKEWKPDAGHFLYAALEILENFFLYKRVLDENIQSVHNLDKPQLSRQICLTVLAPRSYYQIEFREQAIALAKYLNDVLLQVTDYDLSFSFQELPVDFTRDNCVSFFRSINNNTPINLEFIKECRESFLHRAPLQLM